MNGLDNIRVVDVPCFPDRQGLLIAYTGFADFGIDTRRVFVVTGHANSLRGKHAHRQLNQVMVCLQGACRVICDDGANRREYVLTQANRALVVPNGIWAEQLYLIDGSILMVLCDRPYEDADYIRDYSLFLRFRSKA